MNDDLLNSHGLKHLARIISRYQLPAIGFSITSVSGRVSLGASKFGGNPDLSVTTEWPSDRGRPLDFLLQVNLAEIAPFDADRLLPGSGLLSFFYDLENQPWGFDPKELGGYRVLFFPTIEGLASRPALKNQDEWPEFGLSPRQVMTLPNFGSRAMEQLATQAGMTEEEAERYSNFADELEAQFYAEDSARHHLLGHSDNIQGDMQLEAQLVMNGLYCGNQTGYQDSRVQELRHGADDWMLLLQLDSDDSADVMWGDCGRLYFWIKRTDLRQLRFDKVWMSLQCY